MRINFRQLSYIEAAAKHGSIATAAEDLHISKSSISVAIDGFESEFSVTLFVRRPSKGIVLTSDGQRLVDKMRTLLQHARQMEDDIIGTQSDLTDEFSIGCFAPLAPLALPYAVQRMTRQHPRLKIKIIEGDLSYVADLVLKGVVDVALTYDLGQPTGTDFQSFGLARPYALLDRHHAFSDRKSVTLAELAPLPMILLDLPESRTYFDMLFRVADAVPHVVYRAGTFQTLRSFVSYGLGYALLNLKPASDVAYTGRAVCSVPLSDAVPAPIFGVMRRADSFVSPAVTLFTSVCRAYFKSPDGKRHFVGAGRDEEIN